MDAIEARSALDEVNTAQRRSFALAYSAGAGPYLMMWGVIWLACSVATQLSPRFGWVSWPVLGGLGVATGIFWGLRAARGRAAASGREVRRHLGRWLAATAALLVYYQVASLLFGLQGQARQTLFAGLTVGLGYTLIGIWQAAPMAFAGVVLSGLLVTGWVLAPAWFPLWFGIVGGGVLFLTGLWMRSLKG